MQKTVDGKWHIPAADGVTWLCMGDITCPQPLSSGSVSKVSVDEDGSGAGSAVNRMAPRVLPSRYSAPSWKRKYFNALNPFIFDDILHPSDLSKPISACIPNPTASFSATPSNSTSTSNSSSEPSILSSSSVIKSADKKVLDPVDDVL